jgi:hypothetical protein
MRLSELRRVEACRSRRVWGRQAEGPVGFETIIARYQAPYEDEVRRRWIEARLREWLKAVEG